MNKVYYLTSKKLQELRKEFEKLKKTFFSKLTGEVPNILASEDPNPEFLQFEQDLDFLRRRYFQLKEILKNYKLIKLPPKEKRDRIYLGAKVTLKRGAKIEEYEIVGTLEADPETGKISNESPVGKALIGKKVGEKIVLSFSPKKIYQIIKVSYKNN